jgi:chemotaxis protein MotB
MKDLLEPDNNKEKKGGKEDPEASATAITQPPFVSRRQLLRKGEVNAVPLWLVTFADVMALMLTFFVLLYSMSSLDEDQWETVNEKVNKSLSIEQVQDFLSGENDDIEISRISTKKALSIPYLRTLVEGVVSKTPALENAEILEKNNRLIISLPGDMVFTPGGVEVGETGKRALYALAPVLSRIRNEIEVIGHSDPSPIGNESRYGSNRGLSLARAVSVAEALAASGYEDAIAQKGLSDSRYYELADTMEEERRMDLARRVDIVVLRHGGLLN